MATSSTTSRIQVRCLRGVRRADGDLPMGSVLELSAEELASSPAGLYRPVSEEKDPVAEQARARELHAKAAAAAKEAEAELIARRRAEDVQVKLQHLLTADRQLEQWHKAQRQVAERDRAYAAARGSK